MTRQLFYGPVRKTFVKLFGFTIRRDFLIAISPFQKNNNELANASPNHHLRFKQSFLCPKKKQEKSDG